MQPRKKKSWTDDVPPICNICGKVGHLFRECWGKKFNRNTIGHQVTKTNNRGTVGSHYWCLEEWYCSVHINIRGSNWEYTGYISDTANWKCWQSANNIYSAFKLNEHVSRVDAGPVSVSMGKANASSVNCSNTKHMMNHMMNFGKIKSI